MQLMQFEEFTANGGFLNCKKNLVSIAYMDTLCHMYVVKKIKILFLFSFTFWVGPKLNAHLFGICIYLISDCQIGVTVSSLISVLSKTFTLMHVYDSIK